MSQEKLSFRKENIHAEMNMNSEAKDSQKYLSDTVKEMNSVDQKMTPKSETIRKIQSLFSMAMIEYKLLRSSSISIREQGIRAEEICDILRAKVLIQLELMQ